MSFAVIAFLLAATFVTATISGVFGMAGGLILMGVLASIVPVATAMVMHGFIQIVSNGSRAFLLRKHISWAITGRYALGIGAAIALIALALVARGAMRHRELWIGAALGAAFIPFAVELTSYYFAFLIVPALLWSVRREAGIALLLLGASGLFVSLAPLAGMPTWRDEQYTLVALATLLVLLMILLRFAFARPLFQRPSPPV